MSEETVGRFRQWAVVEVMGHLKLAGLVTEEARFGTNLCRVDVYPGDALEPAMTRYFSGASLYGVTVCDEETARAYAAETMEDIQPIARWQLPALRAAQEAKRGDGALDVPRVRRAPEDDDDDEPDDDGDDRPAREIPY